MNNVLRLPLSILCFAGIPPLFAGIILWNALPLSALYILTGAGGVAIYCTIMIATRLRHELQNRPTEVSRIAAGGRRQTYILAV